MYRSMTKLSADLRPELLEDNLSAFKSFWNKLKADLYKTFYLLSTVISEKEDQSSRKNSRAKSEL